MSQPHIDAILEKFVKEYLANIGMAPPGFVAGLDYDSSPSDIKSNTNAAGDKTSDQFLTQFETALRGQLGLFVDPDPSKAKSVKDWSAKSNFEQDVWISQDTHTKLVQIHTSNPDKNPQEIIQNFSWDTYTSKETKKSYENDPASPLQQQMEGIKDMVRPILKMTLGKRREILTQLQADQAFKAEPRISNGFGFVLLHDLYEINAQEDIDIRLPKSGDTVTRVVHFIRADAQNHDVRILDDQGSVIATLNQEGARLEVIPGELSWY